MQDSGTGQRPQTAPGDAPWVPNVPSRRGVLFAAVWLAYLVPTMWDVWVADPFGRRAIAAELTLAVFAAFYIQTFYVIRSRRWRIDGNDLALRMLIARMSIGIGLTVLACVLVGWPGTSLCVYLSVMAVMLLPVRVALGFVVLDILAVEISTRTLPGWKPQDGLAFSIFVSALAVWGISQMIARNQQLVLAKEQIAVLAVAQERNRLARDIHDLLGHSLTVVTVKAELAGRLISIDQERAAKEIADVERLARDALADLRATVAGYREVTLASELSSARTALEAAGIQAELPGALDDVPGERRELFGWAVREGVTNVIRHSGAGRCRIVLSRSAIEILDDGRGPGQLVEDCAEVEAGSRLRAEDSAEGGAPATHRGNGLLGLRERAAVVGSSVLVGRSDEGGFRLRVGG